MASPPVQKWRAAHPDIAITDDALETMAPFASLHANDFAVYMESKGYGAEAVEFVRGIAREMVWTYDNWQKAQRDGDPVKLLTDLLNAASFGKEYEFTAKFIRDYAAANNIQLTPVKDRAAWEAIIPPARDTP